MGMCCNLGDDLSSIAQSLQDGRGGPFQTYEAGDLIRGTQCRVYGAYEGDVSNTALEISTSEGRFMGRAARMATKAAKAALAMSGLTTRAIAVSVGSGTGDANDHVDLMQRLQRSSDIIRCSPAFVPRVMSSTVSANLVNVLRTTGPSMSVSAACAGGALNMMNAASMIQLGYVDAAIAGGAETIDPLFYRGFDVMRALNRRENEDPFRASRPYAADRAGFVFGEGAGVLVLERRSHAEARQAKVLATIRGFGMSSNGDGEMVKPNRRGPMTAMNQALAQSRLAPTDIDYINTHGTSTVLGDIIEVKAMRDVFGDALPPYSSTKGFTGHGVSAAGSIEAIFVVLMLQAGFIAPSIHAEPVDEQLRDTPPITQTAYRELRYALSNSFGFGGTNVALVLERAH